MSAITFDTHKIIKRLEASGIPQAQAEATVEAFAEMVDIGQDALATKADLIALKTELVAVKTELKADVAHLDYRISLLQWMVGILMAGVASLVMKAFFHG